MNVSILPKSQENPIYSTVLSGPYSLYINFDGQNITIKAVCGDNVIPANIPCNFLPIIKLSLQSYVEHIELEKSDSIIIAHKGKMSKFTIYTKLLNGKVARIYDVDYGIPECLMKRSESF